MKLEADAKIAFPRELVYSTYRDRLHELVPFLPDVKGITVTTRTDEPGGKSGVTKFLIHAQASTGLGRLGDLGSGAVDL
jgi:hypothetical protein